MKIGSLMLIMFIPLFCLAAEKDFGYTENKGQVHDQNGNLRPDVLFMHEGSGLKVVLRESGFSYELVRNDVQEVEHSDDPYAEAFQETPAVTQYIHRIDIEWPGANPNIAVSKANPSRDYLNFYKGQNKAEMVRGYQVVTYHNVWDGVDIVFKLQDKQPKYDIVLAPGADLSQVKFQYLGANGLELKEDALLINTSLGELIEDVPASFDASGRHADVHLLLNDGTLCFKGFTENGLLIDPIPYLKWATYYGGSGTDLMNSIDAVDSTGVVMLGRSTATGLATSGAYQEIVNGSFDIMIVRMDPFGQRVWATYFGGDTLDLAGNIVTKGNGKFLIGGHTYSTDLPTSTNAHMTNCNCQNGEPDVYYAEFSNSGFWQGGTYFGGSLFENGLIGLIDDQTYYVYGVTSSMDGIAIPGSFQETLAGDEDVYCAMFDDNWQLQWSTYVGGSEQEHAFGAFYLNGKITLAGSTKSDNLPITSNAYQSDLSGTKDGAIFQFDTSGDQLYTSYFGGPDGFGESLGPIDTDLQGGLYVGGSMPSPNLATAGAAFEQHDVTLNGMLLKMSNSSMQMEWITYTPQPISDLIFSNNELVCIGTTGPLLDVHVTLNALQSQYGGGSKDLFISKFTSSGNAYLYGSYFGGSAQDYPGKMTITEEEEIYYASFTLDPGVVSSGSYQEDHAGGTYDGYLAKFEQYNITVDQFSGGPYCGGEQLSMDFEAQGNFPANPTFELFLYSDPDSLQNGYVIGSVTGVTSGTITGTIPLNVKSDSTYRLTVRNTNLDLFDEDNGSDLIIYGDGQAELWLGPGYCIDLLPLNLDAIIPGGTPDGGFYTGPGVTNNILDPISAGPGPHQIIYSYTDPMGCFTDTASQWYFIKEPEPAVILGPDSLCVNGYEVELEDATPWGGWFSGPDVQFGILDPSAVGLGSTVVDYTYVDIFLCTGSTSHEIWIIPEADTVIVTLSGADLVSSQPYGNQWYRNNSILSGETGQVFTPTFNGIYRVVTDYYGCTLYSNSISLTEVGIEELDNMPYLSVQPNPSDGRFLIQLDNFLEPPTELRVTDVLGSVVYHTTLKLQDNRSDYWLDLSGLANGTYLLQVDGTSQQLNSKIIVQH